MRQLLLYSLVKRVLYVLRFLILIKILFAPFYAVGSAQNYLCSRIILRGYDILSHISNALGN